MSKVDILYNSCKNWKIINKTNINTNYIFIADFGYNPSGSPFLNRNIEKLTHHIQKLNNDSLLLLGGDMFYDTNIDIIQQYKFLKYIYKLKCEWYGVIGNHDYYIHPQLYITNNLFNMSNWYYSIKKNNIVFYMIDTCLIKFNTEDINYKYINKSRNLLPDEELTKNLRTEMLNWLDKELTNNTNKINIIIGHYPIYSYGVYSNYNYEMMKYLFPILKKHNVKLYLSGHEHNNQHIILTDENDKEYYLNVFISGKCIDTDINNDINNIKSNKIKYYNYKDNIILKFFINNNNQIIINLHELHSNEILYNYIIDI